LLPMASRTRIMGVRLRATKAYWSVSVAAVVAVSSFFLEPLLVSGRYY